MSFRGSGGWRVEDAHVQIAYGDGNGRGGSVRLRAYMHLGEGVKIRSVNRLRVVTAYPHLCDAI